MRVSSIISFAIAAAIFTYLIGATLGSPVGQFAGDVTTVVPEAQRDDVDSTTHAIFADEPVTGESVTHRARQEGEDDDDDDDDATTVAALVIPSTKAPIPAPLTNESSVLTEFNFVAQPVAKPIVPVAPVVLQSSGDEEDPDQAAVAPTQVPAQEQSQGADENDESENEISQDDGAGTTFKPSSNFAAEYHYTKQSIEVVPPFVEMKNEDETTVIPSANYSAEEISSFQGQGRAGCECGKLPFKIPVEEQTQINPNPWLVAIVRGGLFAGGRPHCAGTLINNLYVLTSASCMNGLYATSIQVWLTAHDSFEHNQASFGNIKLNVQDILPHPNYNRQTKDNDLALLKLSSAVDISGTSYFVPACLASGTFDFAGTIAKVSGWSDGRSNRMCKAEMPILDNKICNRDSRHAGKITGNMVCAGFLTPSRLEACIGDQGGPLISPNSGRSTLVGVVSWGYEAKNKDYTPTVYTRVSEFSDWVLHNTRDADWCGI